MNRTLPALVCLSALAPASAQFRLVTLDPGHFHAALIQKEMYPGVSNRVAVYAPLGTDLIEHLNRIVLFNTRAGNPTHWELDIHTSDDFFERMLRDRPGNVVVISGRNRGKIDRIKRSVEAGFHVLADKPWVISSADLPELESALRTADGSGVVAYDIMTERYEITSILARLLVNDAAVFGGILPGSEDQPAVAMESVHHLMKRVAGVPNLRPAWFFDISQQGEGLSDVGTHLVDLAQWTVFPEQGLDYRKDIRIAHASRWPLYLTKDEFQRVTGTPPFPAFLSDYVKGGRLEYYCNNLVCYTLRRIHVKLNVMWDYEAPREDIGDSYTAVFHGAKSRVEIRQGEKEHFRPEVYVVPNGSDVLPALRDKIAALQARFPGLSLDTAGGYRIVIPDKYRVGHEAHFAQVARQFFAYAKAHQRVPQWEQQNMLAKYYISTSGVEYGQTPRTSVPRH